jgi:hypothetical protein
VAKKKGKKKSEFATRLASMQDNWEEGRDGAFGKWDDGKYKMQLQDCQIEESKNSGRLQIHAEHFCMEGEQAGEVYHQYLQLETEWGPTFVAQFIEALGQEVPDNFEDMPETVAALAEAAPIYMVKLETKKEFQNLQITKLLEAEAEVEGGDEEEPDEEDYEDAEDEEEEDDADEEEDADEDDEEEDEEDADEEDVDHAEDEDALYTQEEILGMKAQEIRDLVSEHELDVELGSKITKAVKTDVFDALVEAELAEAEEDDDAEEEDEDEDAEADERLEELTAFCQGQDIEVDDDDDSDALIEKINEYDWEEDKLMEHETKLLKDIGADVVPSKKKKAAKKKGGGKKTGKKKTGKKKGKKKK